MALPAGRYGVTKNQLLKIKKLPMNTMGMIKDTKEGIAIIEDGAKASQLIIAGRQFWHNGKLYSADVDIAKDADIITSGEGKNATEMPNITDQLPGTDTEKANEVSIAIVENGSNPSATINAGEQFYHSGILYTATTDIATTDIFIVYPTSEYNCKPSDSVTGQIKAVNDDKCDNSVIGTVEDGTNPTKAYAVGEHMVRGGKFCTVTVAVTTSSTWTLGSNYVEDAVGDRIIRKYQRDGVAVTAGGSNGYTIPTITGYEPYNVTTAFGGADMDKAYVYYQKSGSDLYSINIQNTDATDHTWNVVHIVEYIKTGMIY